MTALVLRSLRMCQLRPAVASVSQIHLSAVTPKRSWPRIFSLGPRSSDPSFQFLKKQHRFRRFRLPVRMKETMETTRKDAKRKREEILKLYQEEKPEGTVAKLKFYFKRYWYIVVPVHIITSCFWFGSFYLLVKSGIDIPSLLEAIHIPQALVDKVKSTPPAAGVVVVTVILYKIAMPVRYATTLGITQIIFSLLRRIRKIKPGT